MKSHEKVYLPHALRNEIPSLLFFFSSEGGAVWRMDFQPMHAWFPYPGCELLNDKSSTSAREGCSHEL